MPSFRPSPRSLTIPLLMALFAPALLFGESDRYFAIEVVDEQSGRGVPLVELTIVNGIRHVTDSAGRVAFFEPGLMGEELFFFVESHGYEHAADGFGNRGFRAVASPGESVQVTVQRTNLAERLYRLSGSGIYRDTILLGLEPPMRQPLLNARVLGQDSVIATIYDDRIYWFWGDTQRPDYPLGNFHASGATTPLPGPEGIDPAVAIDYDYFTDETGFAKEMARMPGHGPTWLSGLTVVPDQDGRLRLVAGYAKIENLLETYARGLAVFDDKREEFVHVADFALDFPLYPTGHALEIRDHGTEYRYFSRSLPLVRAPAAFEALKDLATYEAFTPLAAGSSWEDRKVERDSEGRVVWAWKHGTPVVGPQEQATLIEEGHLQETEALFAPRDVETGQPVLLHTGTVEWNPFRERWILIASELFGSSILGEVWFLEADSPLGPWVYARKVLTHDDYTFYNPRHHRFLDERNGQRIYFEGTYTKMFSGAQTATPRYDYNQVLYRLDLDLPELRLPVAVYREAHTGKSCYLTARSGAKGTGRPEFWALEEPLEGTIPVWCVPDPANECRLASGNAPKEGHSPVFHALPTEPDVTNPDIVPLYSHDDSEKLIGYVWQHPLPNGPALPVHREDSVPNN